MEYGIQINAAPNPDYLDSLIKLLHIKTQQPVVILIDEYDKPITSFITNVSEAKLRRDWLREYYAILKPNAPHIHQIVITGISKYAKTAIFSELNNVKDLTLHPEFNSIVGFTQAQIEKNFSTQIKGFEKITGYITTSFFCTKSLWYQLRENADEAYYHSLFQMALTLIGVRIDTEKSTAQWSSRWYFRIVPYYLYH